MEELNRRKSIVHVHPTVANCCKNLIADVPPGIMEYGTDTTRAILGVLFSGTAARFPTSGSSGRMRVARPRFWRDASNAARGT